MINEMIALSSDLCELTVYYTKNGFLLQVFNKNDIYFSITKETCTITLNLEKIKSLGLNIYEATLLGDKIKMRYSQNNGRLSLTKKLLNLNETQVFKIDPMDLRCFLININ